MRWLHAPVGALIVWTCAPLLAAQNAVQSPADFLGFRVGADNKLARWDRIVDYISFTAAMIRRAEIP
jgi:hypothetical protein